MLSLCLLPLLAGPSQDVEPQFRVVPEVFGTEGLWSEAIGLADIELDGDVDVFVARGEGWMFHGRKHQCTLLVNKLEEEAFRFEDESVERLGYAEAHSKDVATADVNADGWPDALFANAFNTAPPFLFMNRGGERAGTFALESHARGLRETLSSGTAAFGDVDDDGDLDLVIADSGAQFLGPPGGRPRMYINDGTGHFSEVPERLAAPLKIGHMGLHFADIDGDFDVDLIGANREGQEALGHYLLLNDGTGHFHDMSAAMPKTTHGVYECAVGDLDGDTDLDMFFVSLAETDDPEGRWPLGEGPVWNRLIENEELSLEAGPALGKDDDNEVVLLDYDQDGDLDAFIASLGPQEKVLINNGGDFTLDLSIIEVVADPSLDLVAIDVDKDGDMDLLTANARERIGLEQPPLIAFENTGEPDTLAPVVLGVHHLDETVYADETWIVHVAAQDGVIDDGRTWMEAKLFASYPVDETTSDSDERPGQKRPRGSHDPRLADRHRTLRFELPAPEHACAQFSYEILIEDFAGNQTNIDPREVSVEATRPRRERNR